MFEAKKKVQALVSGAKALLARGLGREEQLEESASTRALRAQPKKTVPAARNARKSQATRKIASSGRVQAPRHDSPRGKRSPK